MFYSPLEQFEIISIYFFNIYFLTLFLICSIFLIILFFNFNKFIPFLFQIGMEKGYVIILHLVESNITRLNNFFFPIIFVVFSFILFCNLLGLLPYSFTITSQIITIFFFSFFLFLGLNLLSLNTFKFKFFKLFLPVSDLNLIILCLLIPIEFISYCFRLISLPVRLFSNMVAGHILIKIIISFIFNFLNFNFVIIFSSISTIILLLLSLIILEIGIAFIQSYVFVILLSGYLNEAVNLH